MRFKLDEGKIYSANRTDRIVFLSEGSDVLGYAIISYRISDHHLLKMWRVKRNLLIPGNLLARYYDSEESLDEALFKLMKVLLPYPDSHPEEHIESILNSHDI